MSGNDPEDERAGGPPPDPSDRTWVHPTEMASFVATSRPRSSRRGRWVALAAGVTVVAAVAGVVALMTVNDSGSPAPQVRSGAIQRVVATLAPSIVAVRTTHGDETGRASGVCVQAGQVLTTAHAVDGADAVSIVTADGRTLPAALDASDPVSDLAVLTVDGKSTQPARLGASGGLEVGQQVVGVAAASSGRHRWVDVGEIGAFNRAFVWGQGVSVPGLIETDMTAAGEHSGGALVDSRGAVIGILVVPPDSSTAGLALPIDEARDVTAQLTAHGSAEHGWLGVWATDDTARVGGGARVQGVVPGSPADDAGLVQGDVIVDIGKSGSTTAISSVAQLMSEVGKRKPGEKLNVTLYRDRGKRRVGLELGDQRDGGATAGSAPAEPGDAQ
ncbi:MAG TPA: trypsin-like peptidase domain-containing protein [Acidimicrobiia bacterium]|jgi:S1-C subfamily serine protease|nr:trypsin-like peptidase domain-containing protein [Acidimicrobiia bacterium]